MVCGILDSFSLIDMMKSTVKLLIVGGLVSIFKLKFLFFVCVFFQWDIRLFSKCILVTGGAGFVGSHVNEMLHQHGYETVVIDNLIHGDQRAIHHGIFIKGDVGDRGFLDFIFNNYPIDAVMHFAAFLEVGESMVDPLKYYSNNVAATINLLDAMRSHHVDLFIFSSSCTIFGDKDVDSVAEDHECHPISPYGKSKLTIEMVLNDLHLAYDLRFCSLRYFNAAGGDPEGKIKNYKNKEATLIPVILHNILNNNNSITVFGNDYPTLDGTCVRDYIHVYDIVRAHILALENLLSGGASAFYNLGNNKGYSVKEVINAVEKVLGKRIKIIEGLRRAGDPPRMVADAKKAQEELGWYPLYPSIEVMIKDAWEALLRPSIINVNGAISDGR